VIDLQPLVNKTVPFKFKGAELRLDLSHALFSSFDVDVGTRLLLKAVGRDEVLAGARRILDAGTGVGVIALAMAKAFPEAEVTATDRDLLACAFAERNRSRNKAPNLLSRPGLLGLDPVAVPALSGLPAVSGGPAVSGAPALPAGAEGRYDFILSNIPAKAGAPVIEAFFRDAVRRLLPGGRIGVVIVKPLVEACLAWMEAAGLEIVNTERGSGHMAWVVAPRAEAAAPSVPSAAEPGAGTGAKPGAGPGAAAAPAGPLALAGQDLGVYVRRRGRFKCGEASYEANGYWGLPDFDTVGFAPRVAADLAERVLAGSLVRDALVVNPGLGHFPLWLAKRAAPERLCAASRDLLQLAGTGANLAALSGRKPTYRALDALRLDEEAPASFDLIAEFLDAVPEYDWIGPIWERALLLLKTGATFILVGTPTELQRAEKRRPAGLRLLGEKRRKGFAAAAWRRE